MITTLEANKTWIEIGVFQGKTIRRASPQFKPLPLKEAGILRLSLLSMPQFKQSPQFMLSAYSLWRGKDPKALTARIRPQ